MVKPIKSLKIVGKKPAPGGIVSIEAQWSLDVQLFELLSRIEVLAPLRALAPKVKLIISRSIERAYRTSGLRQVSGKLI